MNKILVLLLICPLIVLGQEGFKPGKIDESLVQMGRCPYDSSAGAYYILEYGETSINALLQVEFRHVVQIKILNKSEFERGDISIPYWTTSGVRGLKAFTYNIENGDLVTTKLDKSQIFKERVDEDWSKLKFSFPNVKEGSVIEYSYSVSNGGISSLNTWYFQTSLPVLKSEYHIRIPQYFDYYRNMTGYITLQTALIENENGRFGDAPIVNNHHHYVALDVPAFENEKFIRSKSDVISKIGFELKRVEVPGSIYENYIFNSYGSLANKLMENNYWSKDIDDAPWAEDELAGLISSEDSLENAINIFNYIKNFEKADASANSLRGCFKDKEGSDYDLNRTLIAVLREAGYNAQPVYIRTRKQGRLDPFNPMVRNFNFIISRVKIGDKTYLMDASEKEHVFGVLPRYCLNGRGLVIQEGALEWEELEPYPSNMEMTQSKLELSEDGLLSGTLEVRRKGYNAWDFEDQLKEEGEESYIKEFSKKKESWVINSHALDDMDDAYSNNELIDVEVDGQLEDLGNVLYLNPRVYTTWDENPLKGTERVYPVDFGVPFSDMMLTEITLPEGIVVETLPEQASIALPNRAGSMVYSATVTGNKIFISQRIKIDKTEYLPEEYPFLREFFAMIVAKSGEQIVLKRL